MAKGVYCHFPYDYTWNNALSSSLSYLCNHQFSSDNRLAMRRNISNVGTLCDRRAAVWAPRRSIAFRNSAGTWSRAPGKQFGVLDRWRYRHTRPARWSDTLRIRPVRWRKWNRIRIDLARLADPIGTKFCFHHGNIIKKLKCMPQAKTMNVTHIKHRYFPFIVYHVTKIQWRPLCNRSFLVGQGKITAVM